MTLGGLALAVGILVDDATVAIENINWHLEQGKDLEPAILDGAQQIAIPAFVSTICICIVFVPMFFLTGVARYLFVPMAEAVVFAMLASYVLSRTLVPTMAKYLLKAHQPRACGAAQPQPVRSRAAGDRSRLHAPARRLSRRARAGCIAARRCSRWSFSPPASLRWCWCRWVGEDFFPAVDSGQFKLHLRAPTGTRIEETAALCDRVETGDPQRDPGAGDRQRHRQHRSAVQRHQPVVHATRRRSDRRTPTSWSTLTTRSPRRPTSYIHDLRRKLAQDFPASSFSFIPADIVTPDPQFRPAGADRRAGGRPQPEGEPPVCAPRWSTRLAQIPGMVDLRVHQAFNQPLLHLDVDRTRAAQTGFTQRDVANNLLISLSRQRADDAYLLAESGDRRQLHDRDADAAVRGRLAAATSATSRSSAPAAGAAAGARGAGDGAPRIAHGGGLALQRAAGHRYLRRGAGARPRRRRARDAADPRRGEEGSAARLAARRARHRSRR